jgi:hypothetical protein
VIPLEETLERFYELGAPLEGFSVAIREAAIEMPLLKRLGEAAFVVCKFISSATRKSAGTTYRTADKIGQKTKVSCQSGFQ